VGNLNLTSDNTFDAASAIGAVNSLAAVNITNGSTITANNSISATNFTIGNLATLNLANNLSTSDGVFLGSGAVFNLSDGASVSGYIDGSSPNSGDLNIINSSSFTNTSAIGSFNSLANIYVESGSNFDLGSDVAANNISVAGALNLGNDSRLITGNVSGSGSAQIDLGSGSHTIDGDFITLAGDSLKLLLTGQTTSGNVLVSGMASISADTNLYITFDTNSYPEKAARYQIVSGNSASEINAIDVTKININGSNSNIYGKRIFTVSQLDDSLYLTVRLMDRTPPTKNTSAINAYNNISQIDSATGNLLAVQQYIDSFVATDSEKDQVLKSVTPQADNSSNVSVLKVINTSINIAENRLQNFHSSDASGVASGDEGSSHGIWLQKFGASIDQRNSAQADGYKSRSQGIAFGIDGETSYNSHLGFSGGYASSKSNSKSSSKATDAGSYQLNVYGGKSFDKFFLDAALGFAWNEYSSTRGISLVNSTAQASYSGQTYIGRVEAGVTQNIGKGFSIIPSLSATFAQNEISKYTESGAGSLDLQVGHNTNRFFESRAGMVLNYNKITRLGYRVSPQIKASYGYDFIGDRQSSQSNFVGQSTSFTSQSAKVYQGSLKLGVGFNIYSSNSVTFSTDYSLEKKHDYNAKSVAVRLRYDF
jgi:outer membrane autotransporter protein